MPLTGTIGATTSANAELQAASNRKALPESVTSFFLPTIERPEIVAERKKQEALQKQQKKKEQRSSRKSTSNRQKEEEIEPASEQEEEGLLDLDESLILLQSLRQSRLTHLTSMLPYLSTRHRTSTRYHPPSKDYPFPGGLDPSIVPPTLLNMGKADIRVGPFVFPRTRFSEARVEGGAQDAQGASLMKGQTSDLTTPVKVKKPRKPKTPKVTTESGVIASNSPASTATAQTPAISSAAPTAPTTPIKPPATNPSTSLASTPSTSAVPMQSTPLTKPAGQMSVPSTSSAVAQPSTIPVATPTRPPMTAAPGAAPINEKVVKAVSAAAQQDPALQNLLYVAANNKASPDQLRELAAFIARVSASLEKIETVQAEERKKEEEKQAKIAAKKAARAADAKARRAAKKAAALAEAQKVGETSADVGEEEASKSGDEESLDTSVPRFLPPPDANQPPPYPPIVIVEFRENPSARFILPLWRDAVVERREEDSIRTIKVSMFLPGIGSSAALRASDDDVNMIATKAKGSKSSSKKSTEPEIEKKDDEKLISPTNPPTDEQLRKAAPKGAETRLVTWSISGTSKEPLSEAIWQIFGRVTGAKTIVDGVEITEEESSANQNNENVEHKSSPNLSEDVLASVIAKIRALPPSTYDHERIPKLRVRPEEIPKDLPDHLTDKFAPRIQILASRPIVRIKRGMGADGEDGEQRFEVIRNIQAGNIISKKLKIKTDEDEGEDTTMGLDGGEDESIFSNGTGLFGDQITKPKRKRHVAKYNPDGTLKLCQACGTNSTPMWRRGPAGKSTLCNACGAKWKVGRLVVPDIPPTAPPHDEIKQTQQESEESKSAAKALDETRGTLADDKEGRNTSEDVSMQEADPTNKGNH